MLHFRILAASALLLALGSCYIPMRFAAEIAISRSGEFSLSYTGILAHAGLIPAFQTRPLSQQEIDRRARDIEADLRRDSGFSQVEFVGNAQFRVDFFKTGNIFVTSSVSFVRSDSKILSINYVAETGEITVRGPSVPQSQKQAVLAAGFNTIGEIRIITDARVIDHNATGVVPAEGGTEYVWIIRDINTPTLLLIIG
ncbi:MAG: hypothetical protein O3C09_04635 [Proteobacteria bacterium]|nr:hypothetical protein [Pseudomonadota bacterium]